MQFKKLFALFCLISFFFLAITKVSAQEQAATTDKKAAPTDTSNDDEEEEEEEEEKKIILIPSPFAHTAVVFPKFPERKIPSGERVEVLLGFVNNADKPFNITQVAGHLVNPADFSYYIENYTKFDFYGSRGLQLQPGKQVSILYVFRPDPVLEPREFGLTLNVFYNDGVANYSTAFYNSTIDIIEPPNRLDSETLFSYFAIAAILGLVVFVSYRSLPSKWTKKSKFSGKLEVGSKTAADDDDWLPANLQRRASKSPRSPKKDKNS